MKLINVVCLALIIISVIASGGSPKTHAQEDVSLAIRIWWPDSLYTVQSQPLVDSIFEDFRQSNSFELRIFQHGADIHRLELTRDVAPNAMPDIMLLRREDLEEAIGSGLLRPLTDWLPSAILEGMSPNLVELGQVNDTLYGLPYMLDVQYMIYAPRIFATPPDDFQKVLAESMPVFFPGEPSSGKVVNDLLVAQYRAAGGQFVDGDGIPMLSERALETVLTFYAEGVDIGIFSPQLLTYTSPASYRSQIINDETALALVDSSYFAGENNPLLSQFSVSALPTPTGTNQILMNGWLWVLLTSDLDKQAQAQRLITLMMDTDKLVDLADATNMLPSQQRALRVLDDPYIDTIRELLPNAVYVGDVANNAAGAALQTAFEAVLNGTAPAEAAETAIQELSSP